MAVALVLEMPNGCVRMKLAGLGTSMAVFRIKENNKIRKYRSGRFLESGIRLLTNDCVYLISVEPKEGILVVWKLLPRDIERQVEDYSALSESEPNDDANCADGVFEYDERGIQRRTSRFPLKTIFERETEYNIVEDYSSPRRLSNVSNKPKRRTRFIFKISAQVEAVAVNSRDTLIVGNSRGQILFFYLKQLSDGIHNFYSTVNLHENEVTTLSVSPDERFVLSGSNDKRMKIFDVREGETQSTLTGHSKAITCVGISSGNQFIVSGSKDHTIRLWNLVNGRLLTTFNVCVPIYSVLMFRQRSDQLSMIALGDVRRKKLMLFRTINLESTNKKENF